MVFIRKTEQFTCEHCGAPVDGNGYTNHCPKCLWSKHVDVDPGDRAAKCGGRMRPVRVEMERGDEYVLVHRCDQCGHEKRNRTVPEDDFETILAIVREGNAKISL